MSPHDGSTGRPAGGRAWVFGDPADAWVTLGVIGASTALVILVPAWQVVAGMVGGVLLVQAVRHPLFWLLGAIGGFVSVGWGSYPGREVVDAVHSAWIVAGLLWWTYRWRLIWERPVPLRPAHWLVLGYLGLGIVTFPLLVLEKGDAFVAFREFLVSVAVLLSIPVLGETRTLRQWLVVGGVLLGVVLLLAFHSIIDYRARVLQAVFTYELESGRRTAVPLPLLGVAVFGMLMGVLCQKLTFRLAWLCAVVVCLAALSLTFYRTFWIVFVLSAIGLVFVLSGQSRRRYVMLIAVSALVVVGSAWVAFGGAAVLGSVGGALMRRAAHTGSGLADPSLMYRVFESRAVLRSIPESPLVGHGIGAALHHFNVLRAETRWDDYFHNGYLSLAYKGGLVGLFLWVGAVLTMARDSWRTVKLLRKAVGRHSAFADKLFFASSLTLLVVLLGFLVASLTLNQWGDYSALALVGVAYGLVGSAARLTEAGDSAAAGVERHLLRRRGIVDG